MLNKAYAEGLRALVLYTASVQDRIVVGGHTGADTTMDEAINDLLLPIVKGAGSERSYDQLAQALQTFGGSGYLQDYPLEQYIRDAKIDTLYEGTTAIQGQDFFFRKIVKNKGAALGALSAEITEFLATIVDEGRLKEEAAALQKALEDFGGIIGAMFQQLMSAQEDIANVYKVGQNTTRLLLSAGDLLVGYLLLRQASVALVKLEANGLSDADHCPARAGRAARGRRVDGQRPDGRSRCLVLSHPSYLGRAAGETCRVSCRSGAKTAVSVV